MKLKDFINVTKKELDDFEAFWLAGVKKEPENFPLDLGEGDWYDQFLLWNSDK